MPSTAASAARCYDAHDLLFCAAKHDSEADAAQSAAADGKREAELPPTLKLMQQNTRLIVLTLEVSIDRLR